MRKREMAKFGSTGRFETTKKVLKSFPQCAVFDVQFETSGGSTELHHFSRYVDLIFGQKEMDAFVHKPQDEN